MHLVNHQSESNISVKLGPLVQVYQNLKYHRVDIIELVDSICRDRADA